MAYRDYYLRCETPELDAMNQAGIKAGVCQLCPDGLVRGSGWDFIGKINKGTGIFSIIEGEQVEQQTPIADDKGIPYIHVNLRTDADVSALKAYLLPEPANPARRWF